MAKERKKAKIILFIAGPYANSAAAEINEAARQHKLKRYKGMGDHEPVDTAVKYLLEKCTSEKDSFEKDLRRLLDKHISEDVKGNIKCFRKDENDLMIVIVDSIKDALKWHGAVRKKLTDLVSCVVVSIYPGRLTVYRNNWKESIHDSSADKIISDVEKMAEAQTTKKVVLSARERMLIRESVNTYLNSTKSIDEEDVARELLRKLGY